MTTNETTDPILRLLGGLPPPVPPAAAAERVRSRCRRALATHQTPQARTRSHTATYSRAFDATLTVAACIYAAASAFEAFRLAGLF